jgi:hypothetical protein
MGILVKRDTISRVGLSAPERARIHNLITARHNQKQRHYVRERIRKEIRRLESEVMTLRSWLHANK